jgi:two-component system nitrogen regulation sensor histidine kinase NtrY
MENIATGVLSINREGSITTFNRSAEKILQIKSEAIKNKPYEETFKSLQLTLLTDLIYRAKEQHLEPLQQEVQLDYQQKPLTLRVKVSTLLDETGQAQGVVVTFDDLTELIKAQKVATWQEVARRIAHEIKNPLTPIQLSAQRLRKKYMENSHDFPSVLEESTRIIMNEVTSLKALVDEFSNFARMPAPTLVPCDLYGIIQEVILRYRGIHRDVEIIYQGPDQFPHLNLDREQIKRVFINLFENAIEAMGKKGRLWVSTALDERDQKVRVEVADEGIGIQPEDFDKLFVPYFSKKKAGTGLGLAIVHRIVSDHNGHIRATRNIPQGTNFVIELPVIS